MPVLATEDEIIPRSVIRHRPIGDGTPPGAKRSVVTTATAPAIQRASRPRPAVADAIDEVAEWQHEDEEDGGKQQVKSRPATKRASTSSRTQPHAQRPATRAKPRARYQAHPLLYLGIGMLAMLMLWTVLTAVFGWMTTALDDLHYGRPRTFQVDAWVGHEQTGNPSHFIALNLNRHIEIIELPGGDASHAHIYVGPELFGPGADLVPVTLRFVDANGDHKPDMLVSFQGTRIVFINDGQQFRPPLPSEQQQINKFLQQIGP